MNTNLIELFESSCEKCGSNDCIKYVGNENIKTLTYIDVNRCVKEFCHSLKTSINAANEFVGIVEGELNIEVVIIVLGIIKSKNAFVFFETSSTNVHEIWNRIQRLNISYLVINSRNVTLEVSSNFSIVDTVQICDEFYEIRRRKKREYRDETASATDFAFVMFSSGSTNDRPKIIRVPHSCIMPNISDLRRIYELQPTDTVLVLTPLTFDPSILDIFLAFSSGSCILLANKNIKYNRTLLKDYFSPTGYNVTIFCTTPSLFLQFFPRNLNLSSLRVLTLGGEAFPRLNLDVWPCLENVRVYNIYGITEVSCWASIHLVTNFEDCTNLGSCLTDTIFDVKNEDNNRLEDGIGELFIGSHTRICLVDGENEFPQNRPVFRASGDLVRIKTDQIYYVGRNDRKIKLFGHQVNLSVIEDRISRHHNVKQCCCVLIPNSRQVVCFVVPFTSNLTIPDLLKFIEDLPSHMMPNDFIFLDKIPLNQHGKVSENACREIYFKKQLTNENPELRFKILWQKYSFQSSKAQIYEEKGFMQCGGHSMSALQFVSELEDSFEIPSNFIALLLSDRSFAECYASIGSSKSSSIKALSQNEDMPVLNHSFIKNTNHHKDLNMESHLEMLRGTMCKGLISTETKLLTDFDGQFEKLEIKWKHDLEKCVDASPTLLVFLTRALVICGSHSGCLITVNIETGNVVSKIRLPDRIESSPCVSKDGCSIFIGCYDGSMYCIDINQGRILWHFQTSDIIKSTAVLHDEKIFFGSYDHHFYCISSSDGLFIWRTKIDAFPVYTTAIVHHRIIVTTLGGSIALLEHNGVIKSKITLDKPFFSNPTELSRLQAFVSIDVTGIIRLFDIDSLTELWKYKVGGNVFSSVTISTSDANSCKIVFGCQDSNVYCFKLSRKEGELLWKTTLNAAVNATPFFTDLKNDFIVGATVAGCIFVLDALEGNVRGTYAINDAIFSSPIVYKNNIVVGSRDNFLYCLKLTDSFPNMPKVFVSISPSSCQLKMSLDWLANSKRIFT